MNARSILFHLVSEKRASILTEGDNEYLKVGSVGKTIPFAPLAPGADSPWNIFDHWQMITWLLWS